MNKTVNINLAGIFFHIDEDAYLKLSRYLEAIKRSFTDSQGRSEIISDIEARIAELFSERIQNEKQVVGMPLVDKVISIMGQPEDYLVDDEIFEDEPQPKYSYRSTTAKKLFRDTDNSYIGGVSSGLGHYLGIEAIWLRLLWILLAIGSGGTFIFVYLVFWALVPEAKTTSEKLYMTGEPINISNIERKIKDNFDTVSENLKNVDFQKQGNRIKSSSQTFFDTLGNIVMFILRIAAKFVGIILMITGISVLIGLIIALFTVGILDSIAIPGIDFLDVANTADIPIWLMSFLLFFAIGIPFFFIFYAGLKILVNNLKSIGNIAKYSLLGIWVLAMIGLLITGIRQATEQAYDTQVTLSEQQLDIRAKDTLFLQMNAHDDYNKYLRRSDNFRVYKINQDSSIIASRNVRLIVRSTEDSISKLVVKGFASGSAYNLAQQRAEAVNYDFDFDGLHLRLDSFFTTNAKNKMANQKIEVLLYLPVKSILYAEDTTNSFHQNYSFQRDILQSGMEEHYLRIDDDEVFCLDCPKEKNETTSDDEAENDEADFDDLDNV